MKTSSLSKYVLSIIIFQVLVIGGMFFKAYLPTITGKSIYLKVRPIDPRSAFRGNYARLSYDINTIKKNDLLAIPKRELRKHEIVYVGLKKDKNGVSYAVSASLTPPKNGDYIKGRTKYKWHNFNNLNLTYGIEAYFLPKEKALTMEKKLRKGMVVEVKLSSNGTSRLIGVKTE